MLFIPNGSCLHTFSGFRSFFVHYFVHLLTSLRGCVFTGFFFYRCVFRWADDLSASEPPVYSCVKQFELHWQDGGDNDTTVSFLLLIFHFHGFLELGLHSGDVGNEGFVCQFNVQLTLKNRYWSFSTREINTNLKLQEKFWSDFGQIETSRPEPQIVPASPECSIRPSVLAWNTGICRCPIPTGNLVCSTRAEQW